MDREQARELFSAYRDEELDPQEVAALERLLEADAECREEYDSFCRLLDGLAGMRAARPPADFADKVKNRIRRRSGGRIFGMARLAGVPRVPYELFSLVLILIILTVYMLTVPMIQVGGQPQSSGNDDQAPEVER